MIRLPSDKFVMLAEVPASVVIVALVEVNVVMFALTAVNDSAFVIVALSRVLPLSVAGMSALTNARNEALLAAPLVGPANTAFAATDVTTATVPHV